MGKKNKLRSQPSAQGKKSKGKQRRGRQANKRSLTKQRKKDRQFKTLRMQSCLGTTTNQNEAWSGVRYSTIYGNKYETHGEETFEFGTHMEMFARWITDDEKAYIFGIISSFLPLFWTKEGHVEKSLFRHSGTSHPQGFQIPRYYWWEDLVDSVEQDKVLSEVWVGASPSERSCFPPLLQGTLETAEKVSALFQKHGVLTIIRKRDNLEKSSDAVYQVMIDPTLSFAIFRVEVVMDSYTAVQSTFGDILIIKTCVALPDPWNGADKEMSIRIQRCSPRVFGIFCSSFVGKPLSDLARAFDHLEKHLLKPKQRSEYQRKLQRNHMYGAPPPVHGAPPPAPADAVEKEDEEVGLKLEQLKVFGTWKFYDNWEDRVWKSWEDCNLHFCVVSKRVDTFIPVGPICKVGPPESKDPK